MMYQLIIGIFLGAIISWVSILVGINIMLDKTDGVEDELLFKDQRGKGN